MISVNVHGIKSIYAHAASHGPHINWVTLKFEGPEGYFEFIMHFESNNGAAEAFAAAINGAKVVPVDEQRAA